MPLPTVTTPSATSEGLPDAAAIYLVARPPIAERPLVVELRHPDGGVDRESFGTDEVVTLHLSVSGGEYAIAADGASCGSLVLRSSREADVVLELGGAECRIELLADHAGYGPHDEGTVWGRLTRPAASMRVTLASLDRPADPVPDRVEVAEDGGFFVPVLRPGSYVATLWDGDAVVSKVRFGLDPGELQAITFEEECDRPRGCETSQ